MENCIKQHINRIFQLRKYLLFKLCWFSNFLQIILKLFKTNFIPLLNKPILIVMNLHLITGKMCIRIKFIFLINLRSKSNTSLLKYIPLHCTISDFSNQHIDSYIYFPLFKQKRRNIFLNKIDPILIESLLHQRINLIITSSNSNTVNSPINLFYQPSPIIYNTTATIPSLTLFWERLPLLALKWHHMKC